MLKRFFPKQFSNSIFEIDFGELYKMGIRGLILDVDNTLVTFDVPKPTEKITSLLNELTEQGFKICLFSNNSEQRMKIFNESLKLNAIHRAGKPGRKGINRAIALMALRHEDVVLVGDQMFTDVWCGNRCGIHTILVKPIAQRDEWTVKLKRVPEKWVMKAYLKYASNKKEANK